jgi:hypothetical protein
MIGFNSRAEYRARKGYGETLRKIGSESVDSDERHYTEQSSVPSVFIASREPSIAEDSVEEKLEAPGYQ